MAEKSLVNEPALMLGAAVDPGDEDVGDAAPDVDVDELDLELLHAASPAAPMTSAVKTLTRLSETLILPPIRSGGTGVPRT
jgi:hypothetical protein